MTKLAQYDDMIRSYAANGISIKEAAANIGVHRSSVWKYATDNGIKFRHSLSRTNDDNHRATMMRDDYLSGQTLDQIGKKHGITRERVRQIITGTYGCLAKVGGQSARAAKNKAARRAKQDAASLQKNGCTYLQCMRPNANVKKGCCGMKEKSRRPRLWLLRLWLVRLLFRLARKVL